MHWGISRGKLDEPLLRTRVDYQMEVGRACVDAGADLIVGHHPHLLQGVECYKNGIICYSIGNFVFARGTGVGAGFPPETVIADCTFKKGQAPDLCFWPVLVDAEDIPHVMSLEDAPGVLQQLTADSVNLGTRFVASKGKIKVRKIG